MRFFSKLFSVDSCPFCGSTDLKKTWDGRYYNSHTIYACRKCGNAITKYSCVHIVASHRRDWLIMKITL